MMEALNSRNEVVARIRKEANSASTGTLIIRSSDSHIAMLGFVSGVLVSLFCESLRGFKAIPRLARIETGTCQFDHSHPAQQHDDLPPIVELLAVLESGAADSPPPSRAPAVNISAEAIARIGTISIEYLGPIGPMFCSNLVKASGGLHSMAAVEKLIDTLASEIDGDAHRQQFRAAAHRCLDK